MGVGIGNNGILAVDIQTLDPSVDHRAEGIGGVKAGLLGQLAAPCLLELLNHGHIGLAVDGDLLIAGVVVGLSTHVAGALYVVLTTQGVHAAAGTAQLAHHHCHVGHGHNALGAGGMLGHAQAVDNGRFLCLGIDPGGLLEVLGINAADMSHPLGGVLHNDLFQLLKALSAGLDELLVDQALVDEYVHHAVGKGHVGAGTELQVHSSGLGKADITGIDHDQLCAVLNCLTNLRADHGMGFLGVGANQQDRVHIMGDVIDGVGHSAGAQGHGQTGNGCGVADAGTVIGVVGAKAGTNHLLHHVDILVGAPGAGKSGQRIGAVFLLDLHELGGHQIQRLIPGCLAELAGFLILDQRIGDAVAAVDKLEGTETALDT